MDRARIQSVFPAAGRLPRLLQGVGALLLATPVAVYATVSGLGMGSPPVTDLLTHLVTGGPFALIVAYGGYRLGRGDLPDRRYRRIGAWFLASGLFFLGLNLLMMIPWGTDSLYRNFIWGMWSLDVGAAGGLAVGVFEARMVERELEAERSRIILSDTST